MNIHDIKYFGGSSVNLRNLDRSRKFTIVFQQQVLRHCFSFILGFVCYNYKLVCV